MTPLELVNLSKLDVLELGSLLPSGAMSVSTAQEAPDSHGELATATAVVITPLTESVTTNLNFGKLVIRVSADA